MKRSEALDKYRETIIDQMVKSYKDVLENKGITEDKIYVWEDGEIEVLSDTQGGSGWLVAKEWEDRELFYAVTVSCPNFDPWDCTADPKPDDEEEAAAYEADIIAEEVDCYRDQADEILDQAIEYAKEEEDEWH